MKKILIPMLILSSLPAFAANIKDAKCSDLTTMNESVTPQYLAVIDGYNKAGKKEVEEVDVGGIVSESKKVNEKCAKNDSMKVEAVRKEMQIDKIASAGKAIINPTKAKCQDFIELGEEVRPVAVFWVAGHNKAGKLKTGEVEEEFLSQPIETLVQDCTAQPTASFYDRTKAWLKKHT